MQRGRGDSSDWLRRGEAPGWQPLARGLKMAAAAAQDAPAAADSSSSSVSSSISSAPPQALEAVAAEWMLEFACSCLCRHFAEQSGAEFWRWRDVAQALITGLSQIPPHQKKTVYLCQLLIRIAQGKSLGLQFENDQRISPLESALSFWTLLEREEIKLEKLHEEIRRLIQIQIVAVHMENRYFKEAAEVLERLFTDSESDKEATKHVVSKGLGATALQNRPVEVNENGKSDLETKQRLVKEKQYTTSQSSGDIKKPIARRHSGQKPKKSRVLQSLNDMQNVGENGVSLACSRRRQKWTHKEDLQLKWGVREFGVGNWAKILAHGSFNNRTSVMLKDRWRTLSKINQS
ncbi:telomeric repeat-binding factor 1 isoform X2 [Motacilla alba alba]|uniref:telomeric repeat-binding factor 1 isoform X2 n=1 Tax=Motacilla alba alba TaxID=1094192 RepID=UPI0018D538A7|nr:telomeric repeat-binding factor 1 isoform X2 [Motacilla alba alba]